MKVCRCGGEQGQVTGLIVLHFSFFFQDQVSQWTGCHWFNWICCWRAPGILMFQPLKSWDHQHGLLHQPLFFFFFTFYNMGLGLGPRSLCIHGKHFVSWFISPAPQNSFYLKYGVPPIWDSKCKEMITWETWLKGLFLTARWPSPIWNSKDHGVLFLERKKKAIALNLINVHYWLYNTTYQKQGLMLPLEKSLILPALSPPDFLIVPLSGLFPDRFVCIYPDQN